MLNDKDKMHPQDMRNLIVFAIVAIALWSLYEIYVLSPKKEAVQQRKHLEQVLAKTEAETGLELSKKVIVRPREDVLQEAARLQIDNGKIFGSLNLKGASLDDLALSEHYKTLDKAEHVALLSPAHTEHPRYLKHGWVAQDETIPLPSDDTVWKIRGNDTLKQDAPVTLVWDNGANLVFERTYSIDENYLITLTQNVQNNSGKEIKLFPYGLITQTGLPAEIHHMWIMHEGLTGFVGNELKQMTYSAIEEDNQWNKTAQEGWLGITDKYWLSSLIPAQGTQNKFRFRYTPNIKDKDNGRYQADYTGAALTIPAGEQASTTNYVFVGAKEVLQLKAYEEQLSIPNFDLAVDFGWFWFMTQPFFYILHWINIFIGNMGVSIICLTLIIRMATYPLTSTSFRSFANMKKVNPQIMELREKYGHDKPRLQEEIVSLYQKEGVNPMAGCLPIVIQIPIFFSLYKVFLVTIEMRHAPFFGWIQDLSAPDPTSIFNLFGMLPFDPSFLPYIGVWPCALLVIMLIQKKLNPPPQDKIQRDMMRIFPFFLVFMMSGFASGLVIYWTFSGFISMLQQMYIMHSLGVPIYLFGQTSDEKKLDEQLDAGGAGVHPLSDMAEDDVEKALFGTDDDDTPLKPVSPPKPKRKKKKK